MHVCIAIEVLDCTIVSPQVRSTISNDLQPVTEICDQNGEEDTSGRADEESCLPATENQLSVSSEASTVVPVESFIEMGTSGESRSSSNADQSVESTGQATETSDKLTDSDSPTEASSIVKTKLSPGKVYTFAIILFYYYIHFL